jgi:subtilisin family serine protease
MSCLGCPGGSCLESNLKACGQFILCPTLPDGSNQDCGKAPRVVTNSWGADRQALTFYDSVISAWRNAGIIPIFSSGNSGPNCSSLNSPGDHRDVISVGATSMNDGIASFSSLGPSTR